VADVDALCNARGIYTGRASHIEDKGLQDPKVLHTNPLSMKPSEAWLKTKGTEIETISLPVEASETSGLPKGGNAYGNGGSVVVKAQDKGAQGPLGLEAKGTSVELPNDYKSFIKKATANVDKSFDHLNTIYGNSQTLIYAYELIKSNPGNMTRGVTPETLDHIDLPWILRIEKELQKGTYRFKTIRRTYIPKPGKLEKRPLGIASPRDKIVQKALQLILEALFEPTFKNCSHGFRPKRGCHTALNQIRMQFHTARWFIETDIRKCFDTIDHNLILHILRKRISCTKTLDLIDSGLKAGYFEEIGNKHFSNEIGTAQGNVLSPLLCNIMLNELDTEITRLSETFSKGTQRRTNPTYKAVYRQLSKLTKGSPEWRKLRAELWKIPSKDPMDTNFKKLYYCRYADDFILSVAGSKDDAKLILNHIKKWLKDNLKLELHPDKTFIRNAKRESTRFLGITIGPNNPGRPIRLYKPGRLGNSQAGKGRVTPRIPMRVDLPLLFKRLKDRGFVKFNHNMHVGIRLGRVHNMDIADIIRYYNAVFRGIWNYYSFTDNCSSLNKVWGTLQESLAYTISSKLRLSGTHKVFKTFGNPIKDKQTGIEFWKPISMKRDANALLQKGATYSYANLITSIERVWNRKMTKTNLGKTCIICKTGQNVEMHHVRSIRSLKQKKTLDFFTLQMAGINRKQVPLCRDHHIALHRNALCERDRELFIQGCKDFVKNRRKETQYS
jgi:group II intron reverse transcriptase/maturase